MIVLDAQDKQFGKNFISYIITDNSTNTVIKKGKCGNWSFISYLFFSLRDEYGENKVKMITR